MITDAEFEAAIRAHNASIDVDSPRAWCEARNVDFEALKRTSEEFSRIAEEPNMPLPGVLAYCMAVGMELERARRDAEELPT
jgi:hypothetical protein